MPIVFVHGVANRNPLGWRGVEHLLRRHVAPVLNPQAPDRVHIGAAFWGDLGVQFRWGGRSRPRSLLGMGSEGEVEWTNRVVESLSWADVLRGTPAPVGQVAPSGGLVAGGATPPPSQAPRWSSLGRDDRSDLLSALILEHFAVPHAAGSGGADEHELAVMLDQADELAGDESVVERLKQQPDAASEVAALTTLLAERLWSEGSAGLVPQGALEAFRGLGARLDEALSRAASWPGALLSRMTLEARPPLHSLLTLFFGDVFWYLARREGATGIGIGEVPMCLLDALLAARQAPQLEDEPLVVLTHSMGGQLLYDALTHFLDRDPRHTGTRVHFWCATASQVGLFLEMGLFCHQVGTPSPPAGSGQTAPPIDPPGPERLGVWWNVWDHNDLLSFTVRDIVRGVDDEAYDSGLPLTGAHSGQLQRVSFYRLLARKLEAAREQGWSTS